MTAGNLQDGEDVNDGGNVSNHLERPDTSTGAVRDGNIIGVPLDRADLLSADGDGRGVGMSNPMGTADADEHDIDGTAASSLDELPPCPLPRQARRQANRQQIGMTGAMDISHCKLRMILRT